MGEQWRSRGAFMVLLALQDGAKHGYEIASHLRQRSDGFFTISFGALYPILHQLERDGLIGGDWQPVGAKPKKVYRLTRAGKKMLAAERARFDEFVGAFGKLLGDKP
ncbi:MAG: helix-turn-helix transcriptional regulator [Deltaproteobacteria bacterium]|nr:helix-turn-helix transcriptional regulator [Deltaproteobacteria bacterium]